MYVFFRKYAVVSFHLMFQISFLLQLHVGRRLIRLFHVILFLRISYFWNGRSISIDQTSKSLNLLERDQFEMMLSIKCFNIKTNFLVYEILCNYCTYGIRCKYINKSCFINLHQNFVNDISAVQRRCRCFFHATVTIYHNDNIQHDSFTLNSTKTQQNMLPLLYIHYTRVSTLLLLISFSL